MTMSTTVWRLLSARHKIVECSVVPTAPPVHAVTVVMGPETFLNECYPDAESAMRRAWQVRDGLLEEGDWMDASA